MSTSAIISDRRALRQVYRPVTPPHPHCLGCPPQVQECRTCHCTRRCMPLHPSHGTQWTSFSLVATSTPETQTSPFVFRVSLLRGTNGHPLLSHIQADDTLPRSSPSTLPCTEGSSAHIAYRSPEPRLSAHRLGRAPSGTPGATTIIDDTFVTTRRIRSMNHAVSIHDFP